MSVIVSIQFLTELKDLNKKVEFYIDHGKGFFSRIFGTIFWALSCKSDANYYVAGSKIKFIDNM